jgi:hypothetical protein
MFKGILEACKGFLVTNGPHFNGGPTSPVGQGLPVNTVYVQNTASGIFIWQKFGAGDTITDWRYYPATGVSFDPTTSDLTQADVQLALVELANRHFGKDAKSQIKFASETTTGNAFDEYDSMTFAVTNSAVNKFRCNIDFYWGHDATSNDIRVRLMVDGAQQGEEMRIEPKDAGTDQRIQNNLLRYVENLSIGNHTLSLEYRPANASRTSRMYYSTIEVWRTE